VRGDLVSCVLMYKGSARLPLRYYWLSSGTRCSYIVSLYRHCFNFSFVVHDFARFMARRINKSRASRSMLAWLSTVTRSRWARNMKRFECVALSRPLSAEWIKTQARFGTWQVVSQTPIDILDAPTTGVRRDHCSHHVHSRYGCYPDSSTPAFSTPAFSAFPDSSQTASSRTDSWRTNYTANEIRSTYWIHDLRSAYAVTILSF